MTTYQKQINQYYQMDESEQESRTNNISNNTELIHACLGLAGESGEVVDLVKKSIFYDRPLDQDKLLEECGDTLHYLCRILTCCGVSLEDAMQSNITKLEARYPDGYSHKAAVERKDKQ